MVTLEGFRDTRRLAQRQLVLWAGSGVVALGLLIWFAVGHLGGVVVVASGIVILLEWQFPIFDKWFDRRRLFLGSECEVWPEEVGLRFIQKGAGTVEMNGTIDWSRISGLREDDRAVLVMDGRTPVVAIPKATVMPPESLAPFIAAIRQRIAERPS